MMTEFWGLTLVLIGFYVNWFDLEWRRKSKPARTKTKIFSTISDSDRVKRCKNYSLRKAAQLNKLQDIWGRPFMGKSDKVMDVIWVGSFRF